MEKGNDKKRILIIDNSKDITGAFLSIFYMVEALTGSFEFIFVVPSHSATKKYLEEHHYRVYEIPFCEIKRNIKNILLYIPFLIINAYRVGSIVKQEKIKILHVNDLYNIVGVVVRIFFPRLALIYHIRLLPASYIKPLYKVYQKLIKAFADKIIVVSHAVKKVFPSSRKLLVIYNNLNIKENHPEKKQFARNSDIQFLYIGNYTQGKGHEDAIYAFEKALKRYSALKLTFIGGTFNLEKNENYKERLIDIVEERGLSKHIQFKNFAYDIEFEIKQADVVLNFSYSESFSRVCLESLYFEAALIASDSGGPAELFEDGTSGILVPLGDIKAYSEAMVRLAKDPDLRRKLGQNGRAFVQTKFSETNTVRKLARVYNTFLS